MAGGGESGDGEPRDHGEGFLTRWSRRKREIAQEAPSDPPPPPAAQAQPAQDERPRDPETGEPIDAELVARLPDLAEIAPGADLSAFMQRGVPEALRRQALRTMWATYPAIRDFVSPALDYAYDYNAPGGAPGYGPLTESDIAQARDFIGKLFSDSDLHDRKPKDEPGGAPGDNESQNVTPLASEPLRLGDDAAHNMAGAAPASDLPNESKTGDFVAETVAGAPLTPLRRNSEPAADAADPAARQALDRPLKRRGGGATPV